MWSNVSLNKANLRLIRLVTFVLYWQERNKAQIKSLAGMKYSLLIGSVNTLYIDHFSKEYCDSI